MVDMHFVISKISKGEIELYNFGRKTGRTTQFLLSRRVPLPRFFSLEVHMYPVFSQNRFNTAYARVQENVGL